MITSASISSAAAGKPSAERRGKLLVAYRLGQRRARDAAIRLIERGEAKLRQVGIEVD